MSWASSRNGNPAYNLVLRGSAQGELRIARQTIDLFRPVPYGELQVDVDTIRQGRRLAVFQTQVRCEGKLLTQATTLCLRSDASLGSVGADHTADAPEPPEAAIPQPSGPSRQRLGVISGHARNAACCPARRVRTPRLSGSGRMLPVLADAPLTPGSPSGEHRRLRFTVRKHATGTQRLCERRHHFAPTSSANQRMELPAYRPRAGRPMEWQRRKLCWAT